jgi:two-component system, OmpR family, alkaline phosphatase synthesis response regulator PhoP
MTPNKKILIIDDEIDILNFLKMRLKDMFQCVATLSSVEGLELAKKEKPDLILLDLMLPRISGFGTLRELKKNPETAHIPVVILTALGDEEIANEAMDIGASGFLTKTCSSDELMAMIQEYIN